MNEDKIKLILHPIRMRILAALSGGIKMTPQQIAEALLDIPQATLYRHLNKLASSGLLQMEDHRQVRGATERVYSLPEGAGVLSEQDLANATPDDHTRFFTSFVAGLLHDFNRYAYQSEGIDPAADGLGYRKRLIAVTAENFGKMSQEIKEVIERYQQIETESDANSLKRLNFAFVSIPEPRKGGTVQHDQ